MNAQSLQRVHQAEVGTQERRMRARYPLALEMSYSVLNGTQRRETRASQTIVT